MDQSHQTLSRSRRGGVVWGRDYLQTYSIMQTGACNGSLANRPLLSHPLLLQLCIHFIKTYEYNYFAQLMPGLSYATGSNTELRIVVPCVLTLRIVVACVLTLKIVFPCVLTYCIPSILTLWIVVPCVLRLRTL